MKFKERLLQGTLIKRYKRFFIDIRYKNKILIAHCPNSGSMMVVRLLMKLQRRSTITMVSAPRPTTLT